MVYFSDYYLLCCYPKPRFSQCFLSCTESSRPKWDQVVTCIQEILLSRFGRGQVFRALAAIALFLVLTNSLLAIVQLSRIIQSELNRLHWVFKRFSDCGVRDASLAIGSWRFGATWCLHFEESAHIIVSVVMMMWMIYLWKMQKEPFVAYFERHSSSHSGCLTWHFVDQVGARKLRRYRWLRRQSNSVMLVQT
jgi:hypothetical protein